MASGEQAGFVFAVTFIVLFAGLTAMVPVEIQGAGSTTEILVPVDPSLVSDWIDYATYNKSTMTQVGSYYFIGYDALGGFDWLAGFTATTEIFEVGAKVYWGPFWLGGLDLVQFISDTGTNYDTSLTLTDVENDGVDGTAKYNLIFSGSGNDAGDFIFYWNATTYSSPSDAWDAGALNLVHGVGFSPNTNIVSLLVGILFLQLPDVPVQINLLLAVFPWASVIYIIWFIVKESLPFF
jgi:hypothetical protein